MAALDLVEDVAPADGARDLELARAQARHPAVARALDPELVQDEARAPVDRVLELVVAEVPQQRSARRTKPVRRVKRM